MIEFTYNNTKNASTGHTLFQLTYGYHLKVLFKEDVNLYSRSCSADELGKKLRELIEVCCQNLLYAPEVQKNTYNKGVKSRSYAPDEKVEFNNKYIKTKKNRKMKNRFFGPFRVLHIVEKQVYKLEFPTR